MKFAYADPPYLGYSVKFYGRMHPKAAVYDTVEGHVALVQRLMDEFPEGWAYSCTSGNLWDLLPAFLPMFAAGQRPRVAAWTKPFASYKPGVNPAYAWEPVIFMGGRNRGRDEETTRDFCAVPITLKRGFQGAKPRDFCFWLFDLLGMEPGDEFHDLFPGSGAVLKAHAAWCQARPLLNAR